MSRVNRLTSVSASFALLVAGLTLAGCAAGGGGGGGGGNVNRNDNGSSSTEQKQDLWTTDSQSASVQDFSSSPVPAGFFDFNGLSCDAFTSATVFVGTALSESTTGAADTIVTRSGDPIAPNDPVGATGTVQVQITSLSLRSSSPITVNCDGEPTQWNVVATLSDTPSPFGTLTAEKTHDNGGTCQTTLFVLLKLIFTHVDDATIQREFDFAAFGLDPVEFIAEMAWVHRIDPTDPNAAAGFNVGVAGGPEAAKLIADGKAGPRLQGGQTLIACSEHNNPGGSHLHNTCTADTDDDDVPDGSDNCRFLFNPDQEDEDEDQFGNLCDPCPEDPACPQSGDECETVCRDVNDELLSTWAGIAPDFCELYADCICIPPVCDPDTFVYTERCAELSQEISTAFQGFSCLYTRFTGWGCDRCMLPTLPPLPCPDPCETLTCPSGQICQQFIGCVEDFDVCQFADCPPGEGCDPQTGLCCETPENGCAFDFCAAITCPAGSQCNPATGGCWDPETGQCFEAEFNFDFCAGVTCDAGEVCDPNTGGCVNPNDPCFNVTCGQSEFCDFETGECVNLCTFITCAEGQTCNLETTVCE